MNRYDHKCKWCPFSLWLQKTSLKFVSLSMRQWEKYAEEWKDDYGSLVDRHRRLKQRFDTLTDLLDFDGHSPTLRTDKASKEQWILKSLHDMQIPFDATSHHFGSSHVK